MESMDTETTGFHRSEPEPGQLVEVRRRQWIVVDVDAGALSDFGTSSQLP